MATQVPPDSDAKILSEHAVVARGAAGSRAVGAVADDPVVGVALRARAEAPGSATDVAALRARWVERVRPAARAAVLSGVPFFALAMCSSAPALNASVERGTPADAVAATMAQSICRHRRDHSARWERVASM